MAAPSCYVAEFVDALLRRSYEASSTATRRARSLATDIMLPSQTEDALAPRRVTPTRGTPVKGGQWWVTAAVPYADAVRYFAIPAITPAGGGSFVVTAAPALVAAPDLHPRCRSPLTRSALRRGR
ncbi:hypothetical protein AB0I66_00105 [Streptomyces sp. NPDC050439]|uniref:hypothetical protein n=1 Tax=unclassified Streptomyces TaxID=2593676 RepID=UPI00341EE479